MSGPWSADQQAWLAALGHRVLVLAGDEAAAPLADPMASVQRVEALPPNSPVPREANAGAVAAPSRSTTAVSSRTPPDAIPQRTSAPSRVRPEADRPVVPSPRAAGPRAPDDALERALLRVTGQRTRSEARAVLEQLGVDLQVLRGNPAAKRALWRQLRPLQPRFRP